MNSESCVKNPTEKTKQSVPNKIPNVSVKSLLLKLVRGPKTRLVPLHWNRSHDLRPGHHAKPISENRDRAENVSGCHSK